MGVGEEVAGGGDWDGVGEGAGDDLVLGGVVATDVRGEVKGLVAEVGIAEVAEGFLVFRLWGGDEVGWGVAGGGEVEAELVGVVAEGANHGLAGGAVVEAVGGGQEYQSGAGGKGALEVSLQESDGGEGVCEDDVAGVPDGLFFAPVVDVGGGWLEVLE